MPIVAYGSTDYFINSAALSSTLSTPQSSERNTVTVPDSFDNLSNANTNAGVDYLTRHLHVPSTGETRLVVEDVAGTGTTRILTLSDDWYEVPAAGATFHVAYHPLDLNAVATIDSAQNILLSSRLNIGSVDHSSILVSITSFLSIRTITRSSGNWVSEGFSAGMDINLSGTTNNNGLLSIASISSSGGGTNNVLNMVSLPGTSQSNVSASITSAEFPFFGAGNARKIFLVDSGIGIGQIRVHGNGRFESGYIADGTNASGALLFGRNNLATPQNIVEQKAGSTVVLRSTLFQPSGLTSWTLENSTAVLEAYDSDMNMLIAQPTGFPKSTYHSAVFSNVTMDSGLRAALSNAGIAPCEVGDSFDGDGVRIVSGEGLSSVTGASAITVRRYTSVFPGYRLGQATTLTLTRDVRMRTGVTWKFIDPVWSSLNDNDPILDWESETSNKLQEMYSLRASITDPGGSPVQGAVVRVIDEATAAGDLQISQVIPYVSVTVGSGIAFVENTAGNISNRDTITRSTGSWVSDGFLAGMTLTVSNAGTDNGTYTLDRVSATKLTLSLTDDLAAGGSTSGDFEGIRALLEQEILNREFTKSGTPVITTYGPFRLKVFKYGRFPSSEYLGALTGPLVRSVSLAADSAITEANEATALSAGSSVAVTHSGTTNKFTSLNYDTGTGLFVATETVTGSSSGATGTVLEVLGDTVEGTLYIQNTSATAFTAADNLSGSASGACSVNGTPSEFSWGIDCASLSLAVVYDYLAAKMAEESPTGVWEAAVIWGTQLLKSGTGGYFTERGDYGATEGVLLYDFAAGSIVSSFMDDGGTLFVPPSKVVLTLTNVVTGSQCYIEDFNGNVLMNESAAAATVTEEYTHTSDVAVTIKVRKSSGGTKYLPFLGGGTITSAGLTVQVNQVQDSIAV